MGPTLVGRSAELATLTAAADAVAAGTGSVVHLVGEAGIGKTTLLNAARSELDRRDIGVRSGTADETDRRRPLVLARALVPELDVSADPDPVGRVIAAVERLAVTGPVGVFADDVHWADDVSLDALRAIARRAAPLGVLLVSAARTHSEPPALRRFDELVGDVGARLAPAPLAPDELVALTEANCGAPPGPELVKLLARSAGNPFLATELLDALVDEGRLVAGEGHVNVEGAEDIPDRLAERVTRRALLSIPDGQLVLQTAAALPGGFTVEELGAVLERPFPDVVGAVTAGIDAGVFVDTGTALAFRHDLLRQAVVEATPPSVMRSVYRQAADVLTARGAAPERVATCVLAGCDPGEPADLDLLVTAGQSMYDSNPAAAADLLRAALDAIPPDDVRSGPTTIALGWALTDAGRSSEVLPLLAERFDRDSTPLSIELQRLRGHALSITGRLDEAARPFVSAGLATVRATTVAHDSSVIDATAEYALLQVLSGRPREAGEALGAIDAASVAPSPLGEANACGARAWVHGITGAFEVAAEAARAGVEAADGDATRAAVRARPTMALAIMLDMLGDGDGALEVLRGADTGPPAPRWNRPLLQFATAVTLHRRGEWDDALAEAEAGLVGADETDLLLGVQGPFAISAAISCARGRLREAHHWLERASRGAGSSTLGVEWMLYATAQVQEADGDPEGAAALLELFIDAALDAGAPALLLNSGGDAVRLAIAAGRPEMAARVTRGLVEVAGRTESPIARATADWARGLSRNDPGPAIAAAGRLTGCQRVPEAARARHDAAVIAARLGNKDEARALAGETFRTYDTLGAEQLHGRLRAELRSAGLPMRPRRSRPRPQSGWESLTPSEQRVVDLVGEGLTNSEIADRLYLSRRTVESHLGRVYTKLDLMTRAQLVAAVVQRRETVGSS